jgi:YD repeat-containing protein
MLMVSSVWAVDNEYNPLIPSGFQDYDAHYLGGLSSSTIIAISTGLTPIPDLTPYALRSDVSLSTNTLQLNINALSVSTGTMQAQINAVQVSTFTVVSLWASSPTISGTFTYSNPVYSKSFVSTSSGTYTRNANGYVTSYTQGKLTYTVTRDANNLVSSITDGIRTWTYSRDSNNYIITKTVTP